MSIENVIDAMLMFQREHHIKGQCITNCQYIHDSLRASGQHTRVKAVYVVGFRPEDQQWIVLGGHLIVEWKGKKLEPSYEISSLHDVSYYDSTKNWINDHKDNIPQEMMKQMIMDHIKFCHFANTINQGKILVADKNYYYSQADYIEQQLQ